MFMVARNVLLSGRICSLFFLERPIWAWPRNPHCRSRSLATQSFCSRFLLDAGGLQSLGGDGSLFLGPFFFLLDVIFAPHIRLGFFSSQTDR